LTNKVVEILLLDPVYFETVKVKNLSVSTRSILCNIVKKNLNKIRG